MHDAEDLSRARDVGRALLGQVTRAMIEIERPARLALVALLADGHLLLEDMPGVGKTTLARIIARTIGGHDARIQCTADLQPMDILGREVPSDNPALRPPEFEYGPIFANAVVLDEINRATAKFQGALFEAMEERFVTVGKRRHALPRPFFCVATMNPFESESEMFHLPHGQRDRFAMRTSMGYPTEHGENRLLEVFGKFDALAEIDPIVAPGDVVTVQRAVSGVQIPDHIRSLVVRLVRATREHPEIAVGASPRAALSLQRCLQAAAVLDGEAYVSERHIAELFQPCLAHRIQLVGGFSNPRNPVDVVAEILERTDLPATQRPAAA